MRRVIGDEQAKRGSACRSLWIQPCPGLGPGAYFGLVTVNAPNVDNAPQSAVVVLNVFPNDAHPGAQVSPYGLVFTTPPEGRSGEPEYLVVQSIEPDADLYGNASAPRHASVVHVELDNGNDCCWDRVWH